MQLAVVAVVLGVVANSRSVAETQPNLSRFERAQVIMGTSITIVLYAPDEASANRAIDAAFAQIREIDRICSDYKPDSELSNLCRDAQPGQAYPVSRELLQVLTASEEISRKSEGAFDVTVGPVVNLWRRARRQKQLPRPDLIAAAKELVDYRMLKIDQQAGTVTFAKRGMQLDLGGIAKGYAADEAIRALRDMGYSRALVAAAGDVVAGDPPPGEKAWKVGLAPLENPEAAPDRFVWLVNSAVSTSGDAFQFVELDGVRYSHIVDPKTGMGLTQSSAVTIVAPSGATADGVASAACVLGPERGLELVEQIDGAEALIRTHANGSILEVQSPDWNRHELSPQR